jgi:hypothetical protein
LTFAVVIAISTAALAGADVLKNAVVENGIGVGGIRNYTAGSPATSINYWIQDTQNNGCDAADGSPATVTLSVTSFPAGSSANAVNISPSNLVFTKCGTSSTNTQAFSFSTAANAVPGDYKITAAVQDANGTYNPTPADFTLRVNAPTATNEPPIANAGGPYTVDEGGSVTLDASSSYDPDGSIASYAWDFNADGVYDDATGVSPTFSAAALDGPGSQLVSLKVTDNNGATATQAVTVTINNVPPTATPNFDSSVNEGGSFNLALTSPSDPSSADTAAGFAYAFNCGDGNGYSSFSATSSASCPTDDNGVRSVGAKIQDKDGGVSTYTGSVTVNNVPPTADLSNNGPVNEGSSATVSFTNQFDPSSVDTATGFHYAFHCDGTPFTTAPSYALSGTSASTSCPFNDDTGGPFTVRALIIDKDGGYTEKTTSVTVNNVAPHITSFTGTPYFYGPNSFVGNTTPSSTFSGAWTDPGTDTWTALLNYPDGSPLSQTLTNLTTRSFSGVTHTFASAGCKSTSLKVTDDDGGYDTATTVTDVGTGSFLAPMTNQPVTDKLKNGQVLPVKVKFTDCSGAPLTNLQPAIRLLKGDLTPTYDDATDTITPASVSAADTTGFMRSMGDGSYIYNLSVNITTNTDYTVIVYPYGTSDPRKLAHVIQATK